MISHAHNSYMKNTDTKGATKLPKEYIATSVKELWVYLLYRLDSTDSYSLMLFYRPYGIRSLTYHR